MKSLHTAIRQHDLETVKLLLQQGATDINKLDSNGFSPLEYTGLFDFKPAIKMLIKAGAIIKGSEILHYAIKKDDINLINTIIKEGKDVDLNEVNSSGYTPLRYAMLYNSKETAKVLIQNGVKAQTPEETQFIDYLDLMEHPLYPNCPAHFLGFDPILQLISQMYFDTPSKIFDKYTSLLNLSKDPVLNKILHTCALDKSFTYEFVDSIQKYSSSCGNVYGCFLHYDKQIMIEYNEYVKNKESNLQSKILLEDTFIHEITHKVLRQIYSIDGSVKLPYNTALEKNAFEHAIKELLDNILKYKSKVSNINALNIPQQHLNSTYEYGKYIVNKISIYAPEKNLCVSKVIQLFLETYTSYKEEKEHIEIIPRYPETIVEGCYHNNEVVKNLLAPIKKYWDEFIDKKLDEHLEIYDQSEICSLPKLDFF